MRMRFALFLALAAAAVLAACGGGGGSGGITPAPLPSSVSMTSSLSAGSTTAVTFSQISNGATASMTLPAASGSTNANLTFETAIPSNVATPSMRTLKGRASIGGSNLQGLAVITLSVSSTVAVTTTPSFSFTLSSAPSGDTYVAYFDENNPANGWNVLLGPGTVSGTTVAFAAQTFAPPFTLTANDTYVFALIASSSAAKQTASLSYSGTKTINYTYGYAFGYPTAAPSAPTPTPEPPTTLSYTVAATVSVGSSPGPTPSASAMIDEHVAETDTGSLDTETYTSDSFLAFNTATTPWTELLQETVQQEPSSANAPAITTNYTNPQTLDQYPATAGATWTNNPAANVAYQYADGDNGVRVVASNGTYTDTENLLTSGSGGGTAVLTENSDGSGSIVGPFFGGGIVSQLAFSAPSPAASPTAVNITIDFTSAAQTNFGYPPSETEADSVWYPLPLAFYNEQDTVTTGTALPPSCIPNALNFTSANDVHRSITTIDTVVGYQDITALDSYEYNGVPVCLVTTDTQAYAYDEQANQPYFILVGNLGVEVVQTEETLVLTGSAPAGQVVAQTASVALQAHELTSFARARAVRMRTYLTKLRGGVR
jgi:hypothetical protein